MNITADVISKISVVFTIILGTVSICITVYLGRKAENISKSSDSKMQALADSQFEEKLAVMKNNIKNSPEFDQNSFNNFVNDFLSANYLHKYISNKNKGNELIDDISEILKSINNDLRKTNIKQLQDIQEIARDEYCRDIRIDNIQQIYVNTNSKHWFDRKIAWEELNSLSQTCYYSV